MRNKSDVNLSAVCTPMTGPVYTPEEALAEAMRCLDCPAQYCRRDCPIHTPVPEMLRALREGDVAAAYKLAVENNPLTATTCRVCPAEKQCRSHCTRSIRGEAVNIPALEHYINELGNKAAIEFAPENGKRVAIVGAGPAGMACAHFLRRSGAEVTVYDAAEHPGGVPRWGIPAFILPEDVTESAVQALFDAGVHLIRGKALGREVYLDALREEYDAVVLALGAPVPVSGGFDEAMQASYLLHEANLGRDAVKGRSVAVFGGGDTAIDAARVAKRLGCGRAAIVYRRGADEMPARREDVETAKAEGIEFCWWTEPVALSEGSIRCRCTEPTPPDYPGGRRGAEGVPGTEFSFGYDLPVLALGFENTPVDGLPCDERGRILADEAGRTALCDVFAAGDAVSGPATVVKAAAAGKRAAEAVLEYWNI